MKWGDKIKKLALVEEKEEIKIKKEREKEKKIERAFPPPHYHHMAQ